MAPSNTPILEEFKIYSDPASFGWRFHVRLNGITLDDTDRQVLETVRPIGVQITDHNFSQEKPYEEWIDDLNNLLDDVYARTGRKRMLVSIDHEGGRVHRLPAPLTHFPAAARWGEYAQQVASAFICELRSIGVNLNFAPVADVHSNPDNPVIGERSFGSDLKLVSDAVSTFVQECNHQQFLCCVKHFPGHGDTAVDSHLELPRVGCSHETLLERELTPFRAAIKSAVPMVMTAHIVFPALDSERPATLSPKILPTLLREELGFDGPVITDDLDMKAITSHYSPEEIARFTVESTCDLLLFNHEPLKSIKVAQELFSLLERGELSEEALAKSHQRVHSLVALLPERVRANVLSDDTLRPHRELRDKLTRR